MDNLLEVRDLTVEFKTDAGALTAVDHVNFDVRKGEVLGLVGESGCGKSVTSMSILRLVPRPPGRFVEGSINYDGKNLLEIPRDELCSIRGREISMIFQEPMTALSPLMKVGNQLAETVRIHNPGISKDEAWQIGVDWLRKVGIPSPEQRMRSYPYEYSGGMRQRAMIAMALLLEPKLIIADEPTTALDVTIQAQVFELMTRTKKHDTSVLLITHDMGVIWEMCDRVIVMYASQIVEEALVKDLFENPLHPYTQGLMKSVPTLTTKADRLTTIEGSVPSPLDYPPGCHFCARCPFAFDRCKAEKPELKTLPNGRRVRCFKVENEMKGEGDASE
jgi:peptide/nickel transport system ATP-binding protein/oligopeptide transport system ATP-binding protein